MGHTPSASKPGLKADLSRILKYAPAELIGRDDELKLLHDAWSGQFVVPPSGSSGVHQPDRLKPGLQTRPHVLTFVALGGEGKTSLVAKWAAELAAQGWPGCDAAFAWSFYSQGTREQLAASSDLFLKAALAFFGDDADRAFAASPAGAFEKGQRLARLVGQRRSLLILDGLEPLQYAPTAPTPGELKDQGVAALLKGLAAASHGLCVVTTRYSLPDLRAFWPAPPSPSGRGAGGEGTACEVKLLRLSRDAGVHLLKALGVRGPAPELATLVEEVKGHALTLTLLGSYLRDVHAGDIRKRDLVKQEEVGAEQESRSTAPDISAYQSWFAENIRIVSQLRGSQDTIASFTESTGLTSFSWVANGLRYTLSVVPVASSCAVEPVPQVVRPSDPKAEVGEKRQLVILVHGIRTRAEWQGRIRHLFESNGRPVVEAIGYGYLDVLRFLCPLLTRRKPVEFVLKKIRDALNLHEGRFDEVIILAHSFGTYIIGQILRENPDIKPDRLLLCGCILAEAYAWDRLPNRPKAVLNEAGSRDIWPILAKSVTWGFGSTGTFGFQTPGVRDRFHNLTHSDYFKAGFAEEYWLPWIRDNVVKPTPYETSERPPTPFWKNLLELLPLKYACLGVSVLLVAWLYFSRAPSAETSSPKFAAESASLTSQFVPPSVELQARLDRALADLAYGYRDWHPLVRVEVEAGSSMRHRVAEALGLAFQKHSMGAFDSTTVRIGFAPDAPISIFYGGADDSLAKSLQTAITALVSGKTAFRSLEAWPTNMFRVFLNGDPMFRADGQAVFQ